MTPVQKVLVAVMPLSIAAVSLFPLSAQAQIGLGIGIGIGGGRWRHHDGGGVFFGISPTIVIPSSRRPDAPPPPDCNAQPALDGKPQAEGEPQTATRERQPVLVTGHWEYLPDGRQRWIPDHYECR